MTAGLPGLPDSSKVAGWWQALAHHRPDGLWFARLLLHHIEALVAVEPAQTLDFFQTAVLRAITSLGPAATVQELVRVLHLGPQMLGAVLHSLRRLGIVTGASESVRLAAAASANTAANSEGLIEERRKFHFLVSDDPSVAPEYLDLRNTICLPFHAGTDWAFDPAILERCIAQAEEWKARRGFPVSVRRLITIARPEVADGLSDSGDPAGNWRKVIYDRPEHLSCVLLRTGEPTKLVAYVVDEDGWRLHSEQPAFELQQDSARLFPDLDGSAKDEDWHQALILWCAGHGVAIEDIHVISVAIRGIDLKVAGSSELLKRLGDRLATLPASEGWLAAGKGRLLRLARVRLEG